MRAVRALLHKRADVLWDDAKHGRLESAFNVVDGFHARVEILDEEREPDTDGQTDDDAQSNIEYFSGPHRVVDGFGHVNDFDNSHARNSRFDLFGNDFEGQTLTNHLEAFEIALNLKVRTPLNRCIDISLLGFGYLGGNLVQFRFSHERSCLKPLENTIQAVVDLAINRIEHFLDTEHFGVFRRIGFTNIGQFLLSISLALDQ